MCSELDQGYAVIPQHALANTFEHDGHQEDLQQCTQSIQLWFYEEHKLGPSIVSTYWTSAPMVSTYSFDCASSCDTRIINFAYNSKFEVSSSWACRLWEQ